MILLANWYHLHLIHFERKHWISCRSLSLPDTERSLGDGCSWLDETATKLSISMLMPLLSIVPHNQPQQGFTLMLNKREMRLMPVEIYSWEPLWKEETLPFTSLQAFFIRTEQNSFHSCQVPQLYKQQVLLTLSKGAERASRISEGTWPPCIAVRT